MTRQIFRSHDPIFTHFLRCKIATGGALPVLTRPWYPDGLPDFIQRRTGA